MTDELDALFNQCHSAFSDHESWVKCRELMYGELTCLGRHTVTGMLAVRLSARKVQYRAGKGTTEKAKAAV